MLAELFGILLPPEQKEMGGEVKSFSGCWNFAEKSLCTKKDFTFLFLEIMI